MADPFEVRMRFNALLNHLSASTTSAMKAAYFAIKHKDMDEDLHSCIIENLERGAPAQNNPAATAASMNNRANIMYFLEHFCDIALKEDHKAYVEFVRRDIGKIVDCVAASGANVKVVRKVVGELGKRGVLEDSTVKSIEEDLNIKGRERGALLGDESEPVESNEVPYPKEGESQAMDGDASRRNTQDHPSVPRSGREGKNSGVSKADKRLIEQRIEEDRERNKRLREGVWAVNGDDMHELDKLWDEGSDLDEDDYIIAGEEADERQQFARYHRALLES